MPQTEHPTRGSWSPLIRALPQLVRPRKVLSWNAETLNTATPDAPTVEAPQAVAWRVFSEDETSKIRRVSRKAGVSVNSFLLKHLDRAVRPSLENSSEKIPWMVPVNLRGRAVQRSDTDNHSSYVAIKISPHDQVQDVHQSIYRKLKREEHWANWKAYELTRSLPEPVKQNLIDTNKAMLQWSVGSFSNLGVWDSDCAIKEEFCAAPWLFAPPVLKCQMIGAGCITFQGNLSLLLQAHPNLTNSKEVAAAWVHSWAKQIDMDIPVSTPLTTT